MNLKILQKLTDLGETLERYISKDRYNQKRVYQLRNKVCFENVTKRDPVQESKQRFQCNIYQARIL